MKTLMRKIEYTFKDEKLLMSALCHSSYANENHNPDGSNERLEFLGDSVLSIVVSDYLFRNHSHLPEGELTKLRASFVCEQSLFSAAVKLDLGAYLQLGKGEKHTGGESRPSILADAFEAVIASIYIDGGISAATTFVRKFIIETPKDNIKGRFEDYKTALQEIIQHNPDEHVDYYVTAVSGPDHNKTFTVEVRLNSSVIGKGEGRSKKEAEQKAAKEALELMGE